MSIRGWIAGAIALIGLVLALGSTVVTLSHPEVKDNLDHAIFGLALMVVGFWLAGRANRCPVCADENKCEHDKSSH